MDPETELATLFALWDTGLATGELQRSRQRWYYECNPQGRPQVFFLREEGRDDAIGAASVASRAMQLGSRRIVAGILVDFVVEPGHRGFFPALALQREVLARAIPGASLVFGIPNRRSEPIFRRVGYRRAGTLARWARVVRSRSYLSRFLPGWMSGVLGAALDRARLAATAMRAGSGADYRWEWRERPDADFDRLWQAVAPCGTLIGRRDSAFLAWRFLDNPYDRNRFFVLVQRSDERMVAYAVCREQGGAMHVADFLVDPGAHGASRRLWVELLGEAYRLRHRSLTVSFLGSEAVQGDLRAAGMVVRDEQPLYAAFAKGDRDLAEAPWYLTNADEDG